MQCWYGGWYIENNSPPFTFAQKVTNSKLIDSTGLWNRSCIMENDKVLI